MAAISDDRKWVVNDYSGMLHFALCRQCRQEFDASNVWMCWECDLAFCGIDCYGIHREQAIEHEEVEKWINDNYKRR